ncbi:MAG: peptidylprolyl isomerase [Coriobacteriales bacterium]|jgi:peptidyl-prolyl cis-trans isomerase B (cyclophilin B)|nr:peptidylprolyl isomerase [Coriobacteriales bacterium]
MSEQKKMQAQQEAKKQRNKRIAIIIVVIIVVIVAAVIIGVAMAGMGNNVASSSTSAASQSASSSSASANASSASQAASSSSASDNQASQIATINVQNFGTITVQLDSKDAPITVANFVKLANQGFYNGLTFHRIVKGFMIQGGDPKGDGTGGSGQTIKGEFSSNGVNNTLSHVRGTISMARSSDPDSASSQFFICDADDSSSLDGKYAAFGTVTSGMDVVDAIASTPVTTSSSGEKSKPVTPVVITSITISNG